MKVNERVVGERFELDGISYEVRLADSCLGCSFYFDVENECFACRASVGHCGGTFRSDNNDVIFVELFGD